MESESTRNPSKRGLVYLSVIGLTGVLLGAFLYFTQIEDIQTGDKKPGDANDPPAKNSDGGADANDEWETETFSEAAGEQLKLLGILCQD